MGLRKPTFHVSVKN